MRRCALAVIVVLISCSSFFLEWDAISGGMPSSDAVGSEQKADAFGDESRWKTGGGAPHHRIVSIPDDPADPYTLIQRWDQGQPNPGGISPEGWYDVAGWEGFETYQINVIWMGDDVLLQLFTDFPETGYGDGAPYGYPVGGLYQLGDLAFDLDWDGVWETGVALIDHGAIPQDPDGFNPPGYGLPADDFVKGGIYEVSAWFTPEDIHYYHWGYAGRFDVNAPKVPIAWMRLGTQIGSAEMTYTDLGTDHPRYQVDVLLKGVNSDRTWNSFILYWGTGNCANDLIISPVWKHHRKPLLQPRPPLVGIPYQTAATRTPHLSLALRSAGDNEY